MNKSLRGEILAIMENSIVEWKHGGPRCVDEILALVESKMPEYKPISKNLVDSPEVEQWNNEAFAFNQAITEVKSILRGSE